MIKEEARWTEIVVFNADSEKDVAVLTRNASIGWTIPVPGDVLTIENRHYKVQSREYIPEERKWILGVCYTSKGVRKDKEES